MADAANDARWRPSVIEIRRVEGSGVGARYHQMLRGPGGRSVAADIVVDKLRPPSWIGFHTVRGPVRPTGH